MLCSITARSLDGLHTIACSRCSLTQRVQSVYAEGWARTRRWRRGGGGKGEDNGIYIKLSKRIVFRSAGTDICTTVRRSCLLFHAHKHRSIMAHTHTQRSTAVAVFFACAFPGLVLHTHTHRAHVFVAHTFCTALGFTISSSNGARCTCSRRNVANAATTAGTPPSLSSSGVRCVV